MSTDLSTETLDAVESARFTRLERTVERAVEVAGKIAGEALATIRDERLYRVSHTTFDDYVRERWGFTRWTANRMIAAATAPEPPALTDPDGAACTKPSSNRRGSAPGRPDSPFELPEPAPAEPAMDVDAGRLWAIVADITDDGRVALDPLDCDEYPPLRAKVLLAWER